MEAMVRVEAAVLEAPMMGPVPDVIERACKGDRDAFAELYDLHADAVYRYVLYRLREPADAEDVTADVFTRAFASIHRYRWVVALKRAITHLTDDQRAVLSMRFVQDLSGAQVAKKLGKNEGAIRALQFRALARLRKMLSREA